MYYVNPPSKDEIDLCLPHRYDDVIDAITHYQERALGASITNWLITIPNKETLLSYIDQFDFDYPYKESLLQHLKTMWESKIINYDKIRENPYQFFDVLIQVIITRIQTFYRGYRGRGRYFFDVKEDNGGYLIYMVFVQSVNPSDQLLTRIRCYYNDFNNNVIEKLCGSTSIANPFKTGKRLRVNPLEGHTFVRPIANNDVIPPNKINEVELTWYADRYYDLAEQMVKRYQPTDILAKYLHITFRFKLPLESFNRKKYNLFIRRMNDKPEYYLNKIKRLLELDYMFNQCSYSIIHVNPLTAVYRPQRDGRLSYNDFYRAVLHTVFKSLSIDPSDRHAVNWVISCLQFDLYID